MPTIKELRQICQNSSQAPSRRTQSIEGKFNRIFSIYFSWLLIRWRMTPNQITALGVLFYLGGAALFIFPVLWPQIAGLVLMWASFVLDACDGEVARYRKSLQPAAGPDYPVGGAYVEPVSHDIMYAFFFLPLGIGEFFASGSIIPLVAASIASSSKLIFRLAECRLEFLERLIALKKGEPPAAHETPAAPATARYFLFRNIFTSTGMFLMLVIAVIWRHIDWFLYFYAAGFLLLWAYKMLRQWKKIKNYR